MSRYPQYQVVPDAKKMRKFSGIKLSYYHNLQVKSFCICCVFYN